MRRENGRTKLKMVAVGCMFRMVYIVIEQCPSPLSLNLWKDGSIPTTDASESLKPLTEAEELKQRREV